MSHAPLTFTIADMTARCRELRLHDYPKIPDALYADETAVVKIADLLQDSMLAHIEGAVQVGMLLHPERTHVICTKFSGECAAEVLPHILAVYPDAEAVKRVVAALTTPPDGDIVTMTDSLRDDIDATIVLSEDAYTQMGISRTDGRDYIDYFYAYLVLSIVYQAGLLRNCATIWQYARFVRQIARARCDYDVAQLEGTTSDALRRRLQPRLIALFNGTDE